MCCVNYFVVSTQRATCYACQAMVKVSILILIASSRWSTPCCAVVTPFQHEIVRHILFRTSTNACKFEILNHRSCSRVNVNCIINHVSCLHSYSTLYPNSSKMTTRASAPNNSNYHATHLWGLAPLRKFSDQLLVDSFAETSVNMFEKDFANVKSTSGRCSVVTSVSVEGRERYGAFAVRWHAILLVWHTIWLYIPTEAE